MSILVRRSLTAALLAVIYVVFCVASGTVIRFFLPALVILVFISFDYILSICCFIYLLVADNGEGLTEDGWND